jgi:uncharacterized protein (TIGR03435 family)
MRSEFRNLLRAAAVMSIAVQGIAYAQTGAAFEVSRVTPTPGRRAVATGLAYGYNPGRVLRTPQRIAFQAALVGDIMAFAYGFPLDRVERRPQWMYDDRYNVAVTTEAPASLPEQKLLLQKLLEERFGLAVHRVSYQSSVYFLVAGPNAHLTPAKEADAQDLPEFRRETIQNDAGRVEAVVHARHASMSDLAVWLYPQLQLPVIDKTGMTGLFDIEIAVPPGRGGSDAAIRAVQSSLGLDLELHRGTAESLIIDRAEEPGAN